jgi:hypothetical protein
MAVEIAEGQVWVEVVRPEHGDDWERIHFVCGVKDYWMAQYKKKAVLTRTKDGSSQIDSDDFAKFAYSGIVVDMQVPCIEQRTIEELGQISANSYSPGCSTETLVDQAFNLLKNLDCIYKVGGFNRRQQVEGAIVSLCDVAAFCGHDVTALRREMWIKNIR